MFPQSVFFVMGFYKQGFVCRSLSGKRFLCQLILLVLNPSLIPHASLEKREVDCSQVSRCSRGLSGFTPCKEIDVVLAAETHRLFVDKQENHTAACEERSQGLPLTALLLYFHGGAFREALSLSLWGL